MNDGLVITLIVPLVSAGIPLLFGLAYVIWRLERLERQREP